jgi:diguanylate cyclase (GGDEF)-like protein
MNAVIIGLAAALAVCIVAAVWLSRLLAKRSPNEGEAKVALVVEGLETRMEELSRELTDAVGRAEGEARRTRFLEQIGGSIELEDILGSTLAAALSLERVDAALVHVEAGAGDQPLVAVSGFEDDEPDAIALFGAPEGRQVRSVELSFRYAGSTGAGALQSALAVPLADRSGRIGWLGVFSRDPDVRLGDADVRRLEELAERVAPAIENGRQLREARLLADLDSLTGLHNRRYFHETLEREVARAHRYARQLSLVLADVDDFKDINDRIGHLAGDEVLAETAERVRGVVRTADVACRVGGDELGVIVPEAGLDEADRLAQRIQHAVTSHPIARAGRVQISAGTAELQSNDDPSSLFERADRALYAAKRNRKGRGSAGTE